MKIRDQEVGVTPLTVKQSPKRPLRIVFEYPGYETRTYVLKNKFQWQWFLLDAPITYGWVCIPFAVDVLTLAPYRFVTKDVMMNFDSIYVAPPEVKPRIHMQRERITLTAKEIETQRKNKTKAKTLLREQQIRYEFTLDSMKRVYHRRSVDSSRVRNLKLATQYKNAVGIQLGGLATNEMDLYYYRNVYKALSLGIELGYKTPDRSTHTHENNDKLNINGPTDEMMFMPYTESYYLGVATRIPIRNLSRGLYYVSFTSFVRNSSFDHAVVSWEDQTGYETVTHYNDSVGVHQNSVGLKIMMGFKPIIKISEKLALEIDLYSGISFRNMTTEIFHYQKTSTTYVDGVASPTAIMMTNVPENNREYFVPLLQLGFKVGVRF